MKLTPNIVLRWVSVLMLASLIYVFSTRKPTGAGPWLSFAHADKAMHFVGYAGLAFFLFRALKEPGLRRVSMGVLAVGVVIATAYGGALELVQGGIEGRTASGWDLVADAAGALAAAALYRFLVPRTAAVA